MLTALLLLAPLLPISQPTSQGGLPRTTDPQLGKLPTLRAPRPGTKLPRLKPRAKIAWLPTTTYYTDADPAFAPELARKGADEGLAKASLDYAAIPASMFDDALKSVGATKVEAGGYDVASAFPAAEGVGADYMGELLIHAVKHTVVNGKPRLTFDATVFLVGTDGDLYSLNEKVPAAYDSLTLPNAASKLASNDVHAWFVNRMKK